MYECLVQNTPDSLLDALVLESMLHIQCTEAEAGLVAKNNLCTCTQEPKLFQMEVT